MLKIQHCIWELLFVFFFTPVWYPVYLSKKLIKIIYRGGARGGRGYSDVISPWNHLMSWTNSLISERIRFFFFKQQTHIHPLLPRFSNKYFQLFLVWFFVSSYQVLPKSKEWSWVTDVHFFTKRTYLGEFDLQNGALPKLCQCPILSSAPYKQFIWSKKLCQQKCACSILWRKRLPALP